LRSLPTNTTEFEVKNSCKNLEDAKYVPFEGNKPHLVREINFNKVVIVGWSNNAGSWGWNFDLNFCLKCVLK